MDVSRGAAFESVQQRSRVYLIANNSGHVKIGVSLNPERRLSTLQCGSPDKLRLLLVVPGDRRLERQLHKMFKHRCIHREWFALTPEDYQLILEVISRPPVEDEPEEPRQRILLDVVTTYRRTVVVEVPGEALAGAGARVGDLLRTSHRSFWPPGLASREGEELFDVSVEGVEERDLDALEADPDARLVLEDGELVFDAE